MFKPTKAPAAGVALLLVSSLFVSACGSETSDSSGPNQDGFTVVPGGDTGVDTPAPPEDALMGQDIGPQSDLFVGSDAAPVDTAQPMDTGGPEPDITTSPEPSAFVGRWATRYWVTSMTEVPVIGGEMETEVRSYQIIEIAEADAGLELTVTTCSIEMIAGEGSLSETIIPDAFVESLPVATRTATETDGGDGFFAEAFYEVRGANLDDLVNESLPTDDWDPRVFDQDEDGYPGMTISVTGFVDGDIYLVQRGWNTLETTSFDGERIHGSTEWGDEQTYLGASSMILEQITPSSWVHPDASKHGFEMVRAPSISCSEVVETATALFDSL